MIASDFSPTLVLKKGRWLMATLACLVLAGCASTSPQPFKEQDVDAQNISDRQKASAQSTPVTGPLSLQEAMARALKYNLQQRVRLLEEALALKQLDVNQLDMLPYLLAKAGYSSRDNDRLSLSRDIATGAVSTTQAVSQDRTHTVSQLGLSWSLLDLGIGYYNSQQQANRVLIASERRRKAMHLLMQDVRSAYWRAASAQALQEKVQKTIEAAEDALRDARRVEQARLRNPLDSLRYQRQLLESLRLLESINQELSSAQIELAALINAPVAERIEVIQPNWGKPKSKILALSVTEMESMAVKQNADLMEERLNVRNAVIETKKVLARLFPNLSFSYGVNYDTDNFQVNNRWNEAGVQLSFNLFNIFTADMQNKLAAAGVTLAEQRRITALMTVIAQVHLARLGLVNATAQYNRSEEIWQTDRKLAEHIAKREEAQTQSRLERVSSETSAILSLLRRYQALAQAQIAEARLVATLGKDPVIGSVDQLSLFDLVQAISAAEK